MINVYEQAAALASVRSKLMDHINEQKVVPGALNLAERYLSLSIKALQSLPEFKDARDADISEWSKLLNSGTDS